MRTAPDYATASLAIRPLAEAALDAIRHGDPVRIAETVKAEMAAVQLRLELSDRRVR
jgi:hypothetical protein